jgi:hypothetical protein
MGKAEGALCLTLLLLSLILFAQSFHVQAQGETSTPTVSIDPVQTDTVDVNDNFTIHVRIDNAVGIEGAQVQFTYESAVLEAVSVEEGPFMQPYVSIVAQLKAENVSEDLGEVLYAAACTSGGTASGSGFLLTVTFTVLAEGSAHFHLLPLVASGTYPGTYFSDMQFNTIIPSLVDGIYGSPVSLTVSPATIYVGDAAILSGKISGSSVANITSVDFLYAPEGGSWADLGTVPINSSGYFSRQWTPSDDGIFYFQVTYVLAGKTGKSTVLQVTVQRHITGYGVYIAYASVGGLIFVIALVMIAHVRERRKESAELERTRASIG